MCLCVCLLASVFFVCSCVAFVCFVCLLVFLFVALMRLYVFVYLFCVLFSPPWSCIYLLICCRLSVNEFVVVVVNVAFYTCICMVCLIVVFICRA